PSGRSTLVRSLSPAYVDHRCVAPRLSLEQRGWPNGMRSRARIMQTSLWGIAEGKKKGASALSRRPLSQEVRAGFRPCANRSDDFGAGSLRAPSSVARWRRHRPAGTDDALHRKSEASPSARRRGPAAYEERSHSLFLMADALS